MHRIGRVGRGGREGIAITLAEPREHRMLKTIERVTKQRIPIEKLPTTADLHARRMELTRAALVEVLLTDDFEQYRVVVETLTDDFDVMQVAMAAVKLAHEASGGGAEEPEIPEAPATTDRGSKERGSRGPKGPKGKPSRESRPAPGGGATVRLYVGAGRKAGIRPQDLVGAIANETTVSGRQIGAIEITDNFSLVDVPEGAAEEVMAALRATRVKGKKVQVRRDRQT